MKKYLIVALGNIGAEYENTRHNIGFKIADELAKSKDVSFDMKRLAFYTTYKFKGKSIHIIKPTTFMNLSGKSIKYWMKELNIPIENTLTLVDDLALPFGKIRLKPKGSDAGHNGLKSIAEHTGSTIYPRLKFGIGDNFSKGKQIDYVLGEWTKQEEEELASYVAESIKSIEDFLFIGLERAMNFNN
ncbi:MAG: PTH1 family peptidyl-tRNA hydrolase [Planctomycetota bacterium]|jgi:PTH1 family peptidyl-tRNA hydrolase